MKKIAVAGLVLCASVPFGTPAQAVQEGVKCAFNSVTDVTTEPGRQQAVLRGGPLVSDVPGTLVCTIQVNEDNHNGSGASLSAHTVGAGPANVAVLPPTPLQYGATAADTVYLCARFEPDNGDTLYWHGGAVPGTGTWDNDPSGPCSQSIQIDPNPQACPVLLAIDERAGTTLADTWQDCGPYEPII